jgi:hypothetical protein
MTEPDVAEAQGPRNSDQYDFFADAWLNEYSGGRCNRDASNNLRSRPRDNNLDKEFGYVFVTGAASLLRGLATKKTALQADDVDADAENTVAAGRLSRCKSHSDVPNGGDVVAADGPNKKAEDSGFSLEMWTTGSLEKEAILQAELRFGHVKAALDPKFPAGPSTKRPRRRSTIAAKKLKLNLFR